MGLTFRISFDLYISGLWAYTYYCGTIRLHRSVTHILDSGCKYVASMCISADSKVSLSPRPYWYSYYYWLIRVCLSKTEVRAS